MEDAPLDPDEDDEMEEEGDEMEEEEMEYEETNSSGTEPSVDEGEEDADHEQDMDVGMEDGQDATWIDEVDEAGTEEDDDAESLPDPIVEAEADIVWQGNPEDDVIVDAVHVDQDDPVDGGNDDGAFRIVLSDVLLDSPFWTSAESSGVSDEDAEGDPPSDDEIILDYADAMVGEEDGGWMIAPQWNAIPPLDHVESHRQAALTARRNQLLGAYPGTISSPMLSLPPKSQILTCSAALPAAQPTLPTPRCIPFSSSNMIDQTQTLPLPGCSVDTIKPVL